VFLAKLAAVRAILLRGPNSVPHKTRCQRKEQSSLKNRGRQGAGPHGSKLVSVLAALEEPAGRFDPWPGDRVGVRGGPGDLQRRQLFGKDLAVDAAGRGGQEPTAGEEDQGEAGLRQPTVWSVGAPPEDAEGTRDDAGDGEGDDLGLPRWPDRGRGTLVSGLLCMHYVCMREKRNMKKEYDFSGGKRGPVIRPKGKTRITIYLDDDVLEAFREKADASGLGYQPLINQALREYLDRSTAPVDEATLRRILREELRAAS
jgi:uncharacterized protein (DUF4415 family)